MRTLSFLILGLLPVHLLFAVDAEVRNVGGLPALCLDGEPVVPLLCVTSDPNAYAAVREGALHMGSNSLYAGIGIETLQALPADCDIEAEVVVLLQDQTYLRLLRNPAFSEPLVYRQLLEECSRIGAPFDIAMLSDLERLPPYRLYIFPDAFYVAPEDRQMLRRVLRREGRTALWVYAPGLWTEQGLSDAAATELTGIRLRQAEVSALPDLRLTALDTPWTQGLSPAFRHLSAVRLDPVVYADDPDATELARMVLRVPLNPRGWDAPVQPREVGVAVRRFGEWTSVFCAVPCLPAELLRSIASAAGVHLYADGGDTIYASQGFLAIHTGSPRARTLWLPEGVRELHEVFSRTRLPVANGQVQITLDSGQTRLWRLVR